MMVNGNLCSPIGANCTAGMQMYTEGRITGFSVKAELPLSEQDRLRVGADLQRYRTGLWSEWESRPNAQWMTQLGARVEQVKMNAGSAVGYNPAGMGFLARDANAFNARDHRSTDINLDATALARYTVSAQYDIEFGFAHKTRSPNVYERFPWSTWQMAALMNNFVGDGNGYVGNLDLKPERANTLSAAFDWHAADKTWGFQATPYHTRVSDCIDALQWDANANKASASPVKNKFSELRYANQTARLFGVDLSGHMPLATTVLGDWGLKGLVNVTNGKNLDTGNGLYNMMPLNGKLALTHKTGGWDNSLELVAVKAKTTVSSVRNEVQTPGYGLVNLRGSYSWKTVRLDFGAENLFDKFYGLPTGGAYVGQGATMINTMLSNYPQWGTAVPGMRRTLHAGVNVKF